MSGSGTHFCITCGSRILDDPIAEECAVLTEAEWLNVLGGVDVFTLSHCEKLVESLRID